MGNKECVPYCASQYFPQELPAMTCNEGDIAVGAVTHVDFPDQNIGGHLGSYETFLVHDMKSTGCPVAGPAVPSSVSLPLLGLWGWEE